MSTNKKLILVIGATGAQGLAIVDALLAPSTDGSPSPYAIRALTRDPESRRAKELATKGVNVCKGSVGNLTDVHNALQGVYGAWVNTDSFTVGEEKEIFLGMRIFELAKQVKTVRHWIWSSLDYVNKLSGYDPKYSAEHYNAKGRVADWLKAQPSIVSDHDMSWSIVTTGPYLDMLNTPFQGPITRRADGTYVFAAPLGNGHAPYISLRDIGYFARYSYDHRAEVSGQDLEIVTEMLGLEDLVSTFTKVTGKKAVAVHLTIEEWFENLTNVDQPVANERRYGDGSTTFKENFTRFWNLYRDDIIKRDVAWNRKINPNGDTLESWMRENNYTGDVLTSTPLLKNSEDGKGSGLNFEHIAATVGKV